MARNAGTEPEKVLDAAIKRVGMTNALAASLTKDALLRNLTIVERLGCLDASGMDEMRHGKSPTVMRGPYAAQELSVDHIIPRAVCPELDNVIANLELLPLRLNQRKNAHVGDRQRALAQKFRDAGLLSAASYKKIIAHP